MSAYQSQLVASVIYNNQPVRETNEGGRRTCYIPFGSEYQLKLKNTTGLRVLAKVSIDGTPIISGDRKFLLGGYGEFVVERFVTDLTQGKKFKFISVEQGAATGEIQDPTSPLNGLIRVEFFKEIIPTYTTAVNNTGGWHSGPTTRSGRGSSCGPLRSASFGGSSAGGTVESNPSFSSVVNNVDAQNFHVGDSTPVDWSAGATAEGGHSAQGFYESHETFPTESVPVTIDIWMKGQPLYVATGPWSLQFVNGVLVPHQNGVPCYSYKRYIQSSDGALTVEF
jgi:hypothetical protein